MIYLDNAATTFPKPPEVIEAMENCLINYAVNAGRGIYSLAQQADQVISETRGMVSDLIGFPSGKTIFTPSATIALNQVIQGIEWRNGDLVYITPFEHNSVMRVLNHVREQYGIQIKRLPVDRQTLEYDLVDAKKMFFQQPPKALVVTHASNVCGMITPLQELFLMAKEYDAITIVDGAQGGPLVPVHDFNALIDFYIFSGHKAFYGPFGIAGFMVNSNVLLKPILFGGTGSHSEDINMPGETPYAFEPGSHNIVAIAGLNAACKWLMKMNPTKIIEHERGLVAQFMTMVKDMSNVSTYISPMTERCVGIISFNVEGFLPQEVAIILNQVYGIQVRAGLHCAPEAHSFLETNRGGTIRIGLSNFTCKNDVNSLVEGLIKM